MISISPTQKVGREKPSMDPLMINLPGQESGRMPAHSPSGIPSNTAISMAERANSIVAGRRSRMSFIAGML